MSEQIVKLERGWLLVRMPLPFSLKWVNSYVLPEEEGGYTIIDPGLNTEESRTLWEEITEHYLGGWSNVKRVVITHQHPDHYGLAGFVQRRSNAAVYMSKRAYAYVRRLWGEGAEKDFDQSLCQLFRENGMPELYITDVQEHLLQFQQRVLPHPAIINFIEPGETLRMAGLDWHCIDAPGHAFGQLCLYNESTSIMFCGDQVLDRITPNISVVPGEEANPLDYFLNSLEALKQYNVRIAYPGHRSPITQFAQRINQLQGHHERRLEQMEQLLQEQARTGFECCEQSFGTHLRGNAHHMRFAMAETLAHLAYLELTKGTVERRLQNGVTVYDAKIV